MRYQLPLEVLTEIGQIEEGMVLEAIGEDGSWKEHLTVVEIDQEEQTVLLDANHPSAGLEL